MKYILCLMLVAASFSSCRPRDGAQIMDFNRDTLLQKVKSLFASDKFKAVDCGRNLGRSQYARCFLTNTYPVEIEERVKDFSDYNLVQLGGWQSMPNSSHLKYKYSGNQRYYFSMSVFSTQSSIGSQHRNSGYDRILILYVDEAY